MRWAKFSRDPWRYVETTFISRTFVSFSFLRFLFRAGPEYFENGFRAGSRRRSRVAFYIRERRAASRYVAELTLKSGECSFLTQFLAYLGDSARRFRAASLRVYTHKGRADDKVAANVRTYSNRATQCHHTINRHPSYIRAVVIVI